MIIEITNDVSKARELFREHAASLDVICRSRQFDDELAPLPADDDPISIARWDDDIAGCVALADRLRPIDCGRSTAADRLRPIDTTRCEMKRLYVRARFQGHKIGRSLAERIIEEARQRGFKRMLLDTLPSMRTALTFFASLGFVDVAIALMARPRRRSTGSSQG